MMRVTHFTSYKRGAGTTTTATIYALARAKSGARVLLASQHPSDAAAVLGDPPRAVGQVTTLGGNLDYVSGVTVLHWRDVEGQGFGDYDEVVTDETMTDVETNTRAGWEVDYVIVARCGYLDIRHLYDAREKGHVPEPAAVVLIADPGAVIDAAQFRGVLGIHGRDDIKVATVPLDRDVRRMTDAGLLTGSVERTRTYRVLGEALVWDAVPEVAAVKGQ